MNRAFTFNHNGAFAFVMRMHKFDKVRFVTQIPTKKWFASFSGDVRLTWEKNDLYSLPKFWVAHIIKLRWFAYAVSSEKKIQLTLQYIWGYERRGDGVSGDVNNIPLK